jgi:putative ABC transport system permease protein
MLELKNVKKSFKTGDFVQQALKGINLNFGDKEFVAILGSSGSGKTTLLNIIGGLDHYDSGDLIIKGKSTKKFKEKDWDAYRNNSIGFIFQSYNLIGHISVLGNIELSMTLSGVSSKEKKKRAMEVLEKVGLKEHAHKKPNQLSGGQMQRVAIARALVNNPEIILADEPTGALDSTTSVQIMELIKNIAKDKLVIMVTHNPELAEKYATRIVEVKDGLVINDTNNEKEQGNSQQEYKLKKTSMGFFTALKLSFTNIWTKKGRTLLTAFASSIGIIGIALILSLSNGFDIQIDEFQKNTLSQMPIAISQVAMNMDEESFAEMTNSSENEEKEIDESKIYPQKQLEDITHTNKFTKEYVNYIENINPDLIGGISYNRATNLNVITKNNNDYKMLDSQTTFFPLPEQIKEGREDTIIKENFELINGKMPTEKEDILLLINTKNQLNSTILKAIGYDNVDSINFDKIVGKEFKLILNDNLYKNKGEFYTINTNYEEMYNNENAVTLKICGIIRGKKDNKFAEMSGNGLTYTQKLMKYVIEKNNESAIVKAQENKDYNILTGEKFEEDSSNQGASTKDTTLAYLGADTVPVMIQIYPKNFETKKEVLAYLDKYNEGKSDDDKIIYTDYAETITTLSGGIMDAITIVLIAFSTISLIVSTIMIAIITYISVLERTKEIGILRAIGARKKDVTRVFNAETFIIGLCSGILGITIANLLTIPINKVILNLTQLENVAKLNPMHAITLIIISIVLTLIGGWIPAKMASKKDPVNALRVE